jgi:hypothetical protein
MNDKQSILKVFLPRAVLKAMTPEAEHAVPESWIESGFVGIRDFPFRVGRESRGVMVDGKFHRLERPRAGRQEPNNDLYLVDAGPELEVSREHFQIERTGEGYRLVDRGSTCGTFVGTLRLGGDEARMSAPLNDGDIIGIGTESTPYRYRFIADIVPDGR